MASSGSSTGYDNHFREKHECFQTSECDCGCEPNMEDDCTDSFDMYSYGLDRNELIEYYSRVCISEGFDVPDFNKSSFYTGVIKPFMKPGKENINSHSLQLLNNCSELAIQDFNRKNAVNYVLVKVVKANVYNYIFYVTFEGKKGSDLVETFEAKVYAEESEQKKMEVLMCRRKKVIYQGSKGQKIPLLTNHFQVNRTNVGGHFHHYSVSLSYEDGRPVYDKDIGRRVIDRIHGSCDTKLAGKEFAYDGDKSLFTIGCLAHDKLEFTIVLEEITSNRNNGNCSPAGEGSPNQNDRKSCLRRGSYQSKSFKVEISFVDTIPVQAIEEALRGQVSENSQGALRVLDIILRQHASKQGCLFVRQSFFHNDPKNFAAIGGGVLRCRGFHSSFRTSQGGLSLNIDVSTTLVIQPGPVVDFLIANQDVKDPFMIDWAKAKRTLKNLRVKTSPANSEYKITGLSDKPCREQTFPLKRKGVKDEDGEVQTIEVTVYDYFVNYRHIELHYSADLPCINVGRPKRPTYFPLELCSLVSLQRYTKALSTFQRASLVEKSRQNPQERMRALSDALKINNYGAVRMLRSCGIVISTNFAQVQGRVLPPPKLKAGNGELFPQNGRWNFNKKKFVVPAKMERWAVVNFSTRCDIRGLLGDLIRIGEMKGIYIDFPHDVLEENPQNRSASPLVRVEKMFECILSKLTGPPQCVICLLPERNSDLYGPWKRKCFAEHGIVTQCMAPTRVNDLYLTNVLLKINAKLGGLNSLLAVEDSLSIPIVSKAPTIILGMNVSHGSPGHSDIPSIAAVVSSRHWPLISRYRASVRTQSAKVQMIDSLYKPVSDNKDDGIIRELLVDFYASSGKRKPDQFIIFRDGVSESQFDQVLNIELHQIMEACNFLDCNWSPKFVLIVAEKNHHTKFFQSGSPDNVPPGTVIDNNICHPQKTNFYLCAHDGMIGTTRPTHYHVLLDEVGFSADDLQELVHSLSYVSQRSTTAISVVAPIRYAHLVATQVRSFMKFEDTSETSSAHGGCGLTAAGAVPDDNLDTSLQQGSDLVPRKVATGVRLHSIYISSTGMLILIWCLARLPLVCT